MKTINHNRIYLLVLFFFTFFLAFGQDDDEYDEDYEDYEEELVLNSKSIILPERFNLIRSRSFKLFIDPENYTHPIESSRVTSRFGYRDIRLNSIYEVGLHRGIDIAASRGTPIYAIFDGTVRVSRYGGGYGKVVVIRHANGLESLYAHLDCYYVEENQEVESGDCIGLCGSTGTRSTGPHLHFELSTEEGRFNPELIINFKDQCLKNNLLLTE